MREIRNLHFTWDFRFGLFRCVDDMRLMLDERPLEALLGAIDVEAFAILPRGVVEKPPDVSNDVGILNGDVARFDGEFIAGFFSDVLAADAAAKATDIFGPLVHQAQAR